MCVTTIVYAMCKVLCSFCVNLNTKQAIDNKVFRLLYYKAFSTISVEVDGDIRILYLTHHIHFCVDDEIMSP